MGGVWAITLTSPRCFCAAIAFANVIGLFDQSSAQYLTSPVSGITFRSPRETFGLAAMIGLE